ncbi:MAG: folylpolyglutamate synthase/dihydrofolate synthase family protein [Candidatus Limivivens sp.]|nr:folylpolyglutamate synthase/dihydrofolate synthase family protein [Candidatus Limivivens sp.]
MNYEEARVYLDEAAKYGSVLGLETMTELLGRLGNPQDSLKFIHIAGTNGKGSVLAYLSTVLTEAGYRVGRYLSPTLFSYREKIQVDGERITREALARLTSRVKDAAEEMKRAGFSRPTVFEMETAISFLYFQETACDLVVLEVGMGGREDATNVVKTTILEVLVSISMDHMGFLGNSLAEIAWNKAGIIKKGTSVVSAVQEPEAMRVIEEECRKQEASLTVADSGQAADVIYGWEEQSFSYGGYEKLKIHLAGSYQIPNAVLAVEALKALQKLGYPVSEAQLRKGLAQTSWRGRFTVLQKDPVFIIDGAHNRDGARNLRRSLELYFQDRRIFYIMGVFKDKEYEEIIKITAPLAAHVTAVQTPGNDRALPARELAAVWKKYHGQVSCQEDLAEAVRENRKLADRKDDVIIAFGSLSFLGALTEALEEVRRQES